MLITSIHIEVSGLVLKPQIPENYNGHKKERNLAVLITSIHIEVSGLVVLKPQIPENYNGHKKERKKERKKAGCAHYFNSY